MSFIGLRNGPGSTQMIVGVLILFAGVDVFTPLDRNGLYHLVSMIDVGFMYCGGVQLRTEQGWKSVGIEPEYRCD